jgi:hypothetical protein
VWTRIRGKDYLFRSLNPLESGYVRAGGSKPSGRNDLRLNLRILPPEKETEDDTQQQNYQDKQG